MNLLSVEISTGRAALFGIPRNLFNVPLPPGPAADAFTCGCFPDLINSLYTYAVAHPELFRGSDDVRGYIAVQEALQEMTGLHIDGQMVVTLNGFVRLVDAIAWSVQEQGLSARLIDAVDDLGVRAFAAQMARLRWLAGESS